MGKLTHDAARAPIRNLSRLLDGAHDAGRGAHHMTVVLRLSQVPHRILGIDLRRTTLDAADTAASAVGVNRWRRDQKCHGCDARRQDGQQRGRHTPVLPCGRIAVH